MDALEANFTLLDHTALRSKAYKRLTRQQEQYCLCRLRGGGVADCRESAGYVKKGPPVEQINENVYLAIQMFREADRQECSIDRQKITHMLLSSHAKASEVRDEINAAVHLGKLHGLFESDQQRGTKVEVNVTNNKLEILSDDDLMQKSSLGIDSLQPEPIEAEHFERIDADTDA